MKVRGATKFRDSWLRFGKFAAPVAQRPPTLQAQDECPLKGASVWLEILQPVECLRDRRGSRKRLLRRSDELLESRVLAKRIEGGVDLEPTGRKEVRHLQQRLELVERLVGLAGKHVDPSELVLEVGPCVSILGHGEKLDAPQALPDGLILAAQIRERETEKDAPLCVVGSCTKLLLDGLARLLGVSAHIRLIALQGTCLRQGKAPGSPVVVERARREAQEQLALPLIEHPDEI